MHNYQTYSEKNFNFDWNEIVINFYETLNKLLSEFSNKKFILKIKTRDINNIKKIYNRFS